MFLGGERMLRSKPRSLYLVVGAGADVQHLAHLLGHCHMAGVGGVGCQALHVVECAHQSQVEFLFGVHVQANLYASERRYNTLQGKKLLTYIWQTCCLNAGLYVIA